MCYDCSFEAVLDNFGEEDQFYIRNHHEGIISDELFESVQTIIQRRSKNKKMQTVNEKFLPENIHLVVCWNVVFAELICQEEAGIPEVNIKNQYGNVLLQQKKAKNTVKSQKGYLKKLLKNLFLKVINFYVIIIRT